MPPRSTGTYVNLARKRRNQSGLWYLRISAGPQRDQYVHTLIAEAMLGRPLADDEEVHHKDGDTLNNAHTNLEVLTVNEHARVTRAIGRVLPPGSIVAPVVDGA